MGIHSEMFGGFLLLGGRRGGQIDLPTKNPSRATCDPKPLAIRSHLIYFTLVTFNIIHEEMATVYRKKRHKICTF